MDSILFIFVEPVVAISAASEGGDRTISTIAIGLLTLVLTAVALWFASRH